MIENLFENNEKEEITEIVYILDSSGSMSSVNYDVISSYNDFIEEQRRVPGRAYFTLLTFNDALYLVEDATPVEDVAELNHNNYHTDGCTALIDAICQQIINTHNRLSQMPAERRPSKVIVAILTDGQENASKRFTAAEAKEMISEHETIFGWEFLFLGANQNAFKVGSQYGIKPGKALSFSASSDGLKHVVAAASRSVASYRTSGAPEGDQFFTEEEHNYQRGLGAAAVPLSR